MIFVWNKKKELKFSEWLLVRLSFGRCRCWVVTLSLFFSVDFNFPSSKLQCFWRLAVARQPCWVVSVLKSVYKLKNNLILCCEVLFVKWLLFTGLMTAVTENMNWGTELWVSFFGIKIFSYFHKMVKLFT